MEVWSVKIERILVATDFSESAEKAVEAATELARKFEAELVLLHAYKIDIPLASPMTAGGYALPADFFERLGTEARQRVEAAAQEITSKGVSTTGIAVEESAAAAIVETAESRDVDLIVMGTRGLTGLKHVALGSVADRVVRLAPCPVLTVGLPD
jgi:nucleotide-binding universal stress UspA family protein